MSRLVNFAIHFKNRPTVAKWAAKLNKNESFRKVNFLNLRAKRRRDPPISNFCRRPTR